MHAVQTVTLVEGSAMNDRPSADGGRGRVISQKSLSSWRFATGERIHFEFKPGGSMISNSRNLPTNEEASMRWIILLTAAGPLALASGSVSAQQQCSQCAQIRSNGEYSCSSIREPDRYNYCIRQADDASARCYRTCINYNGIGPANPPKGNATR